MHPRGAGGGGLGKGIWQLRCRGLRVALWKRWHALGEPQEGTPGWVLRVPPGPATSPLLSPEDRGDGRCCQEKRSRGVARLISNSCVLHIKPEKRLKFLSGSDRCHM